MSDDLTIKKYGQWVLVYAQFPYRKYHTLLIPKRHVTHFSELDTKELTEFASITEDVEKMYRESGVIGDTSIYGEHLFTSWRARSKGEVEKKSVSHLHVHFFPEMDKDSNIALDDMAWDINPTLLRKDH